jgi:hypothetical protein
MFKNVCRESEMGRWAAVEAVVAARFNRVGATPASFLVRHFVAPREQVQAILASAA